MLDQVNIFHKKLMAQWLIDSPNTWSSYVEGDEQLDWPNSLDCYHACTAYFLVCLNHNSLPPGPIEPSSPSTKELHA